MTFLPQYMWAENNKAKNNTSTLSSSTVQNSTLQNYSTVNTNPNEYLVENTPVNHDNESPVKIYSKTNCHFLRPSW